MPLKVNIFETDPQKKLFPKYVPKFIKIENSRQSFFYKVDYSSGYFLRRVYTKFPSIQRDYTLPQWQPNTNYGINALIRPSAAWSATHRGARIVLRNTFLAGNSGAVEPAWPLTFGQTIIDNAVTWQTENAYNIQAPRLNLEFIDSANFFNRQPAPTQADLIGTPAQENNFLIEAPQPVDNDREGLNWNAKTPPTSTATLNFLYKYADVIRIDITGQVKQAVFNGTVWTPNYIDILLVGYYCPTGTLQNE